MTKINTEQESLSISQLKGLMRSGDYELISEITAYSVDYVTKCFNQKRRNRLIIKVGNIIVSNRDRLIKDIKSICELLEK